MNIQGDYEGLFLANILQLLCDDKKNGILRVTSGNKETKVYFMNGTIVYAVGSRKEERLGFILRRNGIVSEEQLKKCLAQAKESKQGIGKILVDKGYISVETLNENSKIQIEEILYNLLLWKEGKFEYKDAKLNLAGMTVTQLNPMKLILEASRRIDELSVLQEQIPSDLIVFKMSGKVQSDQEIKLNANEWRIVSLIDGVRTVRKIIEESEYDQFAVYKILFSIISYGIIEKSGTVKLGEKTEEKEIDDYSSYSAIVTVYKDIFLAIHKQISTELGQQTQSLFDESKDDLDKSFQKIIRVFELDKPIDWNTKAVIEKMKELGELDDDHQFLIEGLDGYTQSLLNKIMDLLGGNPVIEIITEIEKVINYIDKYQAGSAEKRKIVNNIMTILKNTKEKIDKNKKKSRKKRGLFSLFK